MYIEYQVDEFSRDYIKNNGKDSFNVATVNVYDLEDNYLYTKTGRLSDFCTSSKEAQKYYFRLAEYPSTSRKIIRSTYMGVKVSHVASLSYSIPDTVNAALNYYFKSDWYGNDTLNGFNRFKARMTFLSDYYKSIPNEVFNNEICKFLKSSSDFIEIKDLNEYSGVQGIYFLVLGELKTCYVGQAEDLKKRVMRHWSRKDYFSGIGIDLYKAFDTTNLYVIPLPDASSNKINKIEYELTTKLPFFTANRLTGGGMDYIIENHLPLTLDNGL